MKISVLFLFLGTFSLYAGKIYSQETEVSVKLNNVTIREAFSRIEKTSDYVFLVSDEIGTVLNKRVKLSADNKSINEILNILLKNTDLRYRVMDRQILIYEKIKETEVRANVVKQQPKVITVNGVVTDNKKEPLPGASIKIKDTTQGVATDINGTFILPNVSPDVVLEISYVGMQSQTISLNGKTTINIVLLEDESALQELVVMGYQALDKRDVVGSISVIKAKDILTPAHTSIDQMLQGWVPGLMVMNPSSRVGTSPKIKIRGTSTLLGNQDPLWVVDGIIQPDPLHIDANQAMTEDLRNIIGNQISWLNPYDIEDITVLKDASATAIYGSKASNGVIIITTKKSSSDKIGIKYSSSYSFRPQPTYADFNLMNSAERIQYSHDAFQAGARYNDVPIQQIYTYEGLATLYMDRKISKEELDNGISRLQMVNTDWFDLLTRNSFSHNQHLTLSGQSNKLSYNISLGYSDSKGVEINNDVKRFTGRSRMSLNLSPKVSIDFILSGQQSTKKGYGPGVNPLSYATRTSRAIPAFDENGEYVYYKRKSSYDLVLPRPVLGYNILNELEHSGSSSKSSSWNANLNFKWNITPSLKYEFSSGISQFGTNSTSYAGERTFYIASKYRGYDFGTVTPASQEYKAALLPFGGELFSVDMQSININIQNMLTYYKIFQDRHRLNVLLGTELRSGDDNSISNTVWGYVPERGENIMYPATPKDIVPIGVDYDPAATLGLFKNLYEGAYKKHSQTNNFVSLFATLAYSYKNKYVVNFNIRSDASNRFGQNINRRFDPTYSFGFSWRGAEEKWIKNLFKEYVNQFNLRASYGIQGNALTNISPDLIASIGEILPVYNQYSSRINSLPNPNLTWERTKSWNLGLDLSLLNRISMTLEYYGRSSNAVITQPIPQEYGKSYMSINGGLIRNHGVEYSISFNVIDTKDFAWSFGLNSSKNWNKINTDPTVQLQLSNFLYGSNNLILKKGYPVSAFWSYSFKGLNPQTGYPEFNLMDVDSELAKADPSSYLEYSGQREPDFTGGLNTRIRYRSFSIGANFSLLLGSHTRLPSLFTSNHFIAHPDVNVSKELVNVWKKPGDELKTNIPAFYSRGGTSIRLPDKLTSKPMYSMWNESSVRVVNASFLRCNNLSLNWELNHLASKINLKSMMLSASVSNLFVIADKKFQGFDPELGNSVMPRIYSLSINVGF
ncbi:MAG: SusC/RagA family TonB-linked outer membrane protein [Bacteroidia bacterium]|nr:SusC/RagA family TonB-linked outer membrane protein [Bacteroidia bacterium]